jgi:hypothetical protein
MDEVVAELMKVWPEASQGALSSHSIFRHHDETPAHKFESIVKRLPDARLLELTARDSFDDRLATFLLDSVDVEQLPAIGSGKIRVIAVKFPKMWSFDCVVVVPPKIARRFDYQSARLKRITYWVVPVFAFEFRDGEGDKDFWHQINRKDGWNVSVIRWDRSRKYEPVWE